MTEEHSTTIPVFGVNQNHQVLLNGGRRSSLKSPPTPTTLTEMVKLYMTTRKGNSMHFPTMFKTPSLAYFQGLILIHLILLRSNLRMKKLTKLLETTDLWIETIVICSVESYITPSSRVELSGSRSTHLHVVGWILRQRTWGRRPLL